MDKKNDPPLPGEICALMAILAMFGFCGAVGSLVVAAVCPAFAWWSAFVALVVWFYGSYTMYWVLNVIWPRKTANRIWPRNRQPSSLVFADYAVPYGFITGCVALLLGIAAIAAYQAGDRLWFWAQLLGFVISATLAYTTLVLVVKYNYYLRGVKPPY